MTTQYKDVQIVMSDSSIAYLYYVDFPFDFDSKSGFWRFVHEKGSRQSLFNSGEVVNILCCNAGELPS